MKDRRPARIAMILTSAGRLFWDATLHPLRGKHQILVASALPRTI